MPQIEKLGNSSLTITATSAPGSSSRARSAALIPASLPPIARSRTAGQTLSVGVTSEPAPEEPAAVVQHTAGSSPDAPVPQQSCVVIVSAFCGTSARTVYTSQRLSAPATHTLSCSAWQQVTPSSTSVASPAAASRRVALTTSSVVPTSTPRGLSVPACAGFSKSTSFKGGSATAKFAYPGRRLAGSV